MRLGLGRDVALDDLEAAARRVGLVQLFPAQDAGPAQDRGQRRAQLVGERGQELVLGPVGHLRFRARAFGLAIEQGVLHGHGLRLLPGPYLAAGDHEEQPGGHQPAHQHDGHHAPGRVAREVGAAAELERPDAPRHVERGVGAELPQRDGDAVGVGPGVFGSGAAGAVHEGIRPHLPAVVHLDLDVARGLAAEDPPHQVVRADGGIHEALQRGAARLDRLRDPAPHVDGDVHEEGGLRLRVQLLGERDLARSLAEAGVARALHGRAADGIGGHVEAEGRAVFLVEGLEVEDRVFLHSGVFGPVAEPGEALRAHPRREIRHVFRPQALGEPDPLQPRITPLELQPFDVGPEQRAVHLRHGGEEPARRAQEADVSLDAVADRLVRLLGGGLEAELVALARGLGDVGGGGQATQREQRQKRPGQEAPPLPRALLARRHGVFQAYRTCKGRAARARAEVRKG